MPDPAPPSEPETSGYWHDVPPARWEALQRREVAHLLLGIAPALGFDRAMRHVAELERRGIFVVRAADA